MSDGLEIKIGKILDEYTDEVRETMQNCMKRISKETVKRLKETSPKSTGAYAKGWTAKKVSDGRVVDYVIYNKDRAHLTHLLENGHVIANKDGTYGRTNGTPHIKPAEEYAKIEITKEIKKEL